MPNLSVSTFLLSATLAIPALGEPLPVLRLCHELEDLPPYIGSAESRHDLSQPGLVLELIEQAARQAQIQVQLHRQPWLRCIHELQAGTSDGVFVAVWQAGRDAWGQFPGRNPQQQMQVDPRYRLWRVDYPIIVRKGSGLQWDGQRFQGVTHKLSAPLGYVARQHLQDLGVLSSMSLAPAKALNLVARGRLDGYVLEHHIGHALIDRLQLGEELVLLPRPLFKDDWYLPLSHQFYQRYPQVAERFWRALAMQRDQLATELTRRYLHEEGGSAVGHPDSH